MTIISYPQTFKTKRVLHIKPYSSNSLRRLKRNKKKTASLVVVMIIFGLVFLGAYVYLRNAQTTFLIKEKELKNKIEVLKTQNNVLEAELSRFNSFAHFQEVAENLGYRVENNPYYLNPEVNLSLR